MRLSLKLRVELVKCYYEERENASEALRVYRKKMNYRKSFGPCTRRALTKLVLKFESTGSVVDEFRCGRPSAPPATVEVIEKTHKRISEMTPHGESSLRDVSRISGIARSTVHRITRNVLGLHPYRLRRVQELKFTDHGARLSFALKCLNYMGSNDNWLKNIFWTDEAHFHLHGSVNTHNCVIWTTDMPHQVFEKRMHDKYVSVWCGFTAEFIVGPYFYEEPSNKGFSRVTITGARYLNMLGCFAIPSLIEHGALERIIYQQDGAPAHTTRAVLNFLNDRFGSNVVSRGCDVEWPPRSPDMTPADFWLWGYLKSRVYLRAPKSIIELKNAIRSEISNINSDQLQSAVYSFTNRIEAVFNANGGHFEI
jgi:hypothetical protein